MAKSRRSAADDVDGAILELGARRIRLLARRAVVDHQRARRPLPVLAGHPRAELRIPHPPREEQRQRRVEEVGVLEEERPLLREEDLEALVDRHLRLVGLDLAEVGVDGEVEGDRVARHQLHVDAGAALVLAHVGCGVRIEEARPGEGAVGQDLDVAAGRDVGDAVGGGELGDEPAHALRAARPVVGLVVRPDRPHQRQAPLLRAGAILDREPQRLEGHGDQHHVAVVGQLPPRIPLRVEAEVLAEGFRDDAVALDAERRREEEVGALPVVERVEIDPDHVVRAEVLALLHAGADVAARLRADEARCRRCSRRRTDSRRSAASAPRGPSARAAGSRSPSGRASRPRAGSRPASARPGPSGS